METIRMDKQAQDNVDSARMPLDDKQEMDRQLSGIRQ